VNVADADVERFAASAPVLFRLLELRAAGQFADARTVTDRFLRGLPEPLFDWLLVLALGFFRRGDQMDIETLLRSEICALMIRLVLDEQGSNDFVGTDEEFLTMMDRLARLVLLEEQRRAGAFAWIGRYSLLSRVTDTFPPRLPITDRLTGH
jgi:hypothetical protein